MSVWVLELGPPATVRHKASGLSVGRGYSPRGAEHLLERLNKEFADLEVDSLTMSDVIKLRELIKEAKAMRPERKMKKLMVRVVMEIPVWASSEEQAKQIFDEMEDNYELWDYSEDFDTKITVSKEFPDDYNEPSWVVTPSGIEEVERAPFKPVSAP